VLYDEPHAGLDPITADAINDLIVEMVKELGCAAVSITHDLASARKIADEIAMIHAGKIIWRGAAADVDHSDNAFVDQFINGRADGPMSESLTERLQEERRLNLKQSRIVVFQGRPRLRDRVATVFKTEERKAQVDVLLSTWESFQGFSYLHQFPVTLSSRVREVLYFMASQTRWDWRAHLARVLPSAGPLLTKVASHPVTQPVRGLASLPVNLDDAQEGEREREREPDDGAGRICTSS
jgi:ABC-type proline/glycine betaine transport system ATPase subunit